jgi:hypothetical protein
MRTSTALAVALLAAACVVQQPAKTTAQITNYEAKGNLQAIQPIGCVSLAELTNRHTPADIFPGVRKCIDDGGYGKAFDLLALAGVYGRFDMLRVADPSAHQAIIVLQMNNIGSLKQARVDAFMESMKGRFDAGSTDLVRICDHVKRIGAPAYHPAYMLQHGISAFTGRGGGLNIDFNPAEAWAASLDGYLHCPK